MKGGGRRDIGFSSAVAAALARKSATGIHEPSPFLSALLLRLHTLPFSIFVDLVREACHSGMVLDDDRGHSIAVIPFVL